MAANDGKILRDVTDIPTAGTAVQLTTSILHAKAATFQAHPDNTGNIAIGGSDVSMTNAAIIILGPGDFARVSFGKGSIEASFFYADTATNGDDVIWAMIT